MTNSFFEICVSMVLLILLSIPLGKYLAHIYSGKIVWLMRWMSPVERFIYKLFSVNDSEEMSWKVYIRDFLIFNIWGIVILFFIQVFQNHLPLNPQHLPGLSWDLALNTAVSFVTNTNWQSYGGETTMSYFTQMFGLTVQNFVSAAAGMAACAAFLRGFVRHSTEMIGNFWVDLTRSVLYVLLPLAIIFALFLVSQGVVQTFKPYVNVQTLEGQSQSIAVGPAAAQISIKQIGSNGGGFFNVNSAHPFENPTPLSNFLETMAILLIPFAFPIFLGEFLNKRKEGWAVFIAMLILFVAGLGLALSSEMRGNPILKNSGVHCGINMEGKEVRFGVIPSVYWEAATTATSNGSVNAMHDSFTPISGLVAMFNIAIGEVIFGGVGVGLIGMMFYAILALFIIGLMIGRTPELYNKKLGESEMSMTVIAIVLPCVTLLALTAIAVALPVGLAGLNNSGPHGFSEIFYAYASGVGNNGSAFAGLTANTPFYNLTLTLAMLIGRFATIVPALVIAGSLAQKKMSPENRATLPTASPVFVGILCATVIVIGALTFFPAVTIGPVLEHFQMTAGKLF
ncbi:MAG: potassium-transporting ATPase subunit KdpA [Candidatus Omnitrophica bacterium]|nr:potassium-transporting ATPase subunit KdpA [Candidatus Omnitrophota bacterium]